MSLIKGLFLFFFFIFPMENAVSSTSVNAPAVSNPNSTPPMNTPVNTMPADLDAETLALLQDLDRQATRDVKNLIPEIKLVQTDKQVIELAALLHKPVQKGQFIGISYDADGNKIYEDFGMNFDAIILKNTNSYNLYDETEGKSTFYSSEYEGKVIPTVALKRAEDKKILFKGSSHDLKNYLLANFPAPL